MMERVCYLCGKTPAIADGTGFPSLGKFFCTVPCIRTVLDVAKDYAHSKRGRKRTKSQWLAVVDEIKSKMPAPAVRVHIRWMIRVDMPAVLEIESHQRSPHGEEQFLLWLRERNSIGMVAEHGSEIVGFMIYQLHKHRLEVLNFAVHPDWRHRGVGTAMIEKLKGKLASHRRVRLRAVVDDANMDFLLFLRRMGFAAKPMTHGDDTVTMEHSIASDEPESFRTANRIAMYMED